MATVRIPSPLRTLTGGRSEVAVSRGDLRDVIDELERRHPGVGDRLLDGTGQLQRFVNVFVGDEDVRSLAGLDTPVGDDDTVSIVPAVAGGARSARRAAACPALLSRRGACGRGRR